MELAQQIVKLVNEPRGGQQRQGQGKGDDEVEKVQVILHLTCTNMSKKLVDGALKVSEKIRQTKPTGVVGCLTQHDLIGTLILPPPFPSPPLSHALLIR